MRKLRNEGVRTVRISDGENAGIHQALARELSECEERFDRERFIEWLRQSKAGRHEATLAECERLEKEVRRRAGGFSPRCAQRMLAFYKAAGEKIAVRAVTSSLRKMRNGLVNDYMKIIEEEIQ